jgi:hypothetical protein
MSRFGLIYISFCVSCLSVSPICAFKNVKAIGGSGEPEKVGQRHRTLQFFKPIRTVSEASTAQS